MAPSYDPNTNYEIKIWEAGPQTGPHTNAARSNLSAGR